MDIRDKYIIEESCCVLNSGEAIESEIEKDDLDLLVDALDKDLDNFFDNEEFANDVNDVVDEIEIRPEYPCPNCEKTCKLNGQKKHIRAKHEQKLNESTTQFLTMKDVENMLTKAIAKITEDLYRETACICTNLKPSQLCLDHMDKLCRQFMKKSDQDCLVHRLYKLLVDEPVKLVIVSYTKDHKWSHLQIVTAVNLLFIHIPELLVAAWKDKLGQESKTPETEITEKEYGPLSYLMGSVISKMFRTSKYKKNSRSGDENNEELKMLLQSLKVPDNEYIKSLSRGELWTPCENLIAIGFEAEKEFRCETATFNVTKAIPVGELRTRIFSSPKVKSLWNNILEANPYPVSHDCSKICLENIIFLYLKIRAFSLAKDVINKYKKQNAARSKKALRKALKQESETSINTSE
jgi:hypothetical protein